MTIKNHPDYASECDRLKETYDYLDSTIYTIAKNKQNFQDEIKDAYIHLDFLDSSQSYSTIMLNSRLIDHLEKNFGLLLHAKKKPYFARMDIQEKDRDKRESLYIGKVSLFDDTMDLPLVVDWRAPIASVYYDGRIGLTSYTVEGQTIDIELFMKRQYTFDESKLTHFMDIDISTSDTFLQAALEGHASDKLKDIVSTIQAEQNRIIRSDLDKPLIVQGVAGSGKTTIALHRIAYLLYTYSDNFRPDQFMIIAPNHLFLDYISSVLPELGADKIKQTTYIDLMYEIIEEKYKLTDSNLKLNQLASQSQAGDHAMIKAAAAFKNSIAMKDHIDAYIETIKAKILPQEDLYLDGHCLVRRQDVHRLFFDQYSYLPVYKRVEGISTYLKANIKGQVKQLLIDTEKNYNGQLDHIRASHAPNEDRRLLIVGLIEEREATLKRLSNQGKTLVKKYMALFFKDKILGFYEDFWQQVPMDEPLKELILLQVRQSIKKKCFELEDLAGLAYLKAQLFGLRENLDIKNVVIDEAQDFSDFQFYVLKKVLQTNRFTILGDLSQGIHMYRSIKDWTYVQHHIFDEETAYLTLEQSYRTTIEIMALANTVILQDPTPPVTLAEPVVRHGHVPHVEAFTKADDLIATLQASIKKWRADGLTTLAVIAKSNEEAQFIYKALQGDTDPSMALIDENSEHFDHHTLVMPAHLSKGLEFDGVLVANIHEHYHHNTLDVKLMYVAMTRAMHRLDVYYMDESVHYFDPVN